ncbi:hypothetical protein, partial [Caballeronia glathei]|uniref:hypothetical protein n=1 Tax=Caballeronia glathei TaxID=60547 RepID=UPI0019D36F74
VSQQLFHHYAPHWVATEGVPSPGIAGRVRLSWVILDHSLRERAYKKLLRVRRVSPSAERKSAT